MAPHSAVQPRTATAWLAMVAATALWGVSGGFISQIPINGFTAAAVVELVTGLSLTAVSRIQGAPLVAIVRAMGAKRLFMLSIVEAGNVTFYYEALHLAPVGLVMAVHLMAPIFLMLISFARRQRSLQPRNLLALALLFVAVVLIGLSQDHSHTSGKLWLGLGLSLLSAGCVAWFVTMVSSLTHRAPGATGAGLQMLCSGLLMLPFLAGLRGHISVLPSLVLVSLLLFAPACWLYWAANKHLDPISVGTIQLFEPPFGAVTVGAIGLLRAAVHACSSAATIVLSYRASTVLWQTLIVAAILAAVYLDLKPDRSEA